MCRVYIQWPQFFTDADYIQFTFLSFEISRAPDRFSFDLGFLGIGIEGYINFK